MLHRCSTALLVVLSFIVVADANAQLFGRRRASSPDLKAMEEYYDDLEDYYEDRNPRLAREAERMENYYEDLRKGRRVDPPNVSLPGVRLMVQPRILQNVYPERSVLVPAEGTPQANRSQRSHGSQPAYRSQPAHRAPANGSQPANGRWQSWGQSAPVVESAPQPSVPARPQPPTTSGEPTLAPEPTEAYRVPTDATQSPGDLRFPPSTATDPHSRLQASHETLVGELEGLAARNPAAAGQWLQYLALPAANSREVAPIEHYSTMTGRQQLAQTLDRFNNIAGNPEYAMVTRLPSFGSTRTALQSLLGWLEQQPTLAEPEGAVRAEELPVPPAS